MYVQPEDWPYFREYYADFVICIDATASMAPILNAVKANVLSLLDRFIETLNEWDHKVEQLRVKLIAFRDYAYDEEPMVESAFFMLPEQEDAFKSCLDGIEAKGGGGGAENALEALSLALESDWIAEGPWRRHIVLLYSDAGALPLGARAGCPQYPAGMPNSIEQLAEWWQDYKRVPGCIYRGGWRTARRLIVFAPKAWPWAEMETWNHCLPIYSCAGLDLPDIELCMVGDFLEGESEP